MDGSTNLGPLFSKLAAALRSRVAMAALRQGGWPFPTRSMDRLRDLSISLTGIGSASLGVDESGEGELLRRLALLWSERDELIVVDVGAYTGEYGLAARSAFGQKARIHCFEPNPGHFAALARRFDGDAQTTCHQRALGSVTGSAPLFLDLPGSSRASLVRGSFQITGTPITHAHEVSVKTLDEIAGELELPRIDLLKLDVEGHELAVLHGAHELVAQNRITVIQFEFGERNLASRTYLRDFFGLLGPRFSFFRIAPRGLVPIDYRPKHEVFALETNYVAAAGDTARLRA